LFGQQDEGCFEAFPHHLPQQGHKPAALRSARSLATLSEPVIGFSPDAGRPGLRLKRSGVSFAAPVLSFAMRIPVLFR